MGKKVAIIGAGCSGITAIKSLLDKGIHDIVCFEQNESIGGNWIYTAGPSHSSITSTTHIISSKTLSAYSDYPMPDSYPDYPSHQQVLQYFEDYVSHFMLKPYIKFNTKVEKVVYNDEKKWEIHFNNQKETFDFLLVSNGHHSVPRYPELPGKFSGRILHSHDFKNNQSFKDEKVLIIGGGNSGCDCAVECSRVAEKTFISLRRPHYIVPKFFLGKPTDTFNEKMSWVPEFIASKLRRLSLKIQIGNYEDYGLQSPDFPVTKDHPTLNSELLYKLRHGNVLPKPGISGIEGWEVKFEDGSAEHIDTIIAATGYKIATPFFDSAFLDYAEADRIPLYLRMFHDLYRNLIFIGLVQPQGAVWPLSEAQSLLAADYINGHFQLPENLKERIEKECNEIEHQFLKSKRHTIEVHYHDYLKKLQKLIKK